MAMKFTPLMGVIGPGFWQKLYDKKLDTLKLETRPVTIHGSYRNGENTIDFGYKFESYDIIVLSPVRW